MNRYITYSAMAKLQHLIASNPGVVAIMMKFSKNANRFTIEYLQRVSYDSYANDITLCMNPTIYTNLNTFHKLNDAAIDFDYATDEFIITRET